MEIIILPNDSDVAQLAAEKVCSTINTKKNAVLSLPTGSTPVAMYKKLVEKFNNKEVDFSEVMTFNLDEYVGLPCDHPSSYCQFMHSNFFKHINLKKDNIFIPNGVAEDIELECKEFEDAMAKKGGVDLQILGIGRDGHIAFNEPSSSLASRTRLKTLTEVTRQDNAKNFASINEVPHHVITMGVGTIMEAKRILLIATGEAKASAVAQAAEGPITASCPASVLQHHPKVTFIVDEKAASQLQRKDYYKDVFAKKPDWQF